MIDWDFETGRRGRISPIQRTRRWQIALTLVVFIGLMATWWYFASVGDRDPRKIDQQDVVMLQLHVVANFEQDGLHVVRGTIADTGVSVLYSDTLDGPAIGQSSQLDIERTWHSTDETPVDDVPWMMVANAVVVCQQLEWCEWIVDWLAWVIE